MPKVIASSVRKGNVLDLDGKLAVVIHAENIHPGKGTPVTHLEMRRIADGVKLTERYRTTDQVERAYLDDKDYNYLLPGRLRLHLHAPGDVRADHGVEGRHGRPGAVAAGRHDAARCRCTRASPSRSSCRRA